MFYHSDYRSLDTIRTKLPSSIREVFNPLPILHNVEINVQHEDKSSISSDSYDAHDTYHVDELNEQNRKNILESFNINISNLNGNIFEVTF